MYALFSLWNEFWTREQFDREINTTCITALFGMPINDVRNLLLYRLIEWLPSKEKLKKKKINLILTFHFHLATKKQGKRKILRKMLSYLLLWLQLWLNRIFLFQVAQITGFPSKVFSCLKCVLKNNMRTSRPLTSSSTVKHTMKRFHSKAGRRMKHNLNQSI